MIQIGDMVQIKSREWVTSYPRIYERTYNVPGSLLFIDEMLPLCGKRAIVVGKRGEDVLVLQGLNTLGYGITTSMVEVVGVTSR